MSHISKEQYKSYPKLVSCENGEYKLSFEQFKEDVLRCSKVRRASIWNVESLDKECLRYEKAVINYYNSIGKSFCKNKYGVAFGSKLSIFDQYNKGLDFCCSLIIGEICG